ncbi:MAG: hypothetical protein CBR30_01475 [Dictyoglomus sp. NZ13-RE01]|nr:MAG: hypothetical protein CBR30_01475 [Dictyoglomus sp. NZ13-RE01]
MLNLFGKWLIILGVILIILGIVLSYGLKFFPIGRLPGDIRIEKKNFVFYFPVTTSIILSIILTIILSIIFRILK